MVLLHGIIDECIPITKKSNLTQPRDLEKRKWNFENLFQQSSGKKNFEN